MSTTTEARPTTTYDRLKGLCVARGKAAEHKKIANNTWVEHVTLAAGDAYAVRLHSTQVLVAYSDGTIVLDSGGWKTMTTKERMHEHLPTGVQVRSVKGEWRVDSFTTVHGPVTTESPWGTYEREDHWDVAYADGITLEETDEGLRPVVGTYPEEDAVKAATKAKAALRKRVKAYVENVQPVLGEWQRMMRGGGRTPDGRGDCLYCQMLVTDARSGAVVTDTDHLWSHVRENYLPVRMLQAAVNDGRVWLWVRMGFRERLNKALISYLMTNLGAEPVVETSDHFDASLLDAAREALTGPSDFGYFGDDYSLWVTSAPTWGRTRDSENDVLANFEAVSEALAAEFPELLAEGSTTIEKSENPGGMYIFGCSHWAVGWTEQIVVPVLRNGTEITRENLHPAFVRVMEYVRAVEQFPVLAMAEERYDVLQAEDAEREAEWERDNN